MAIKLSSLDISAVYLGSTEITAIYLGTAEVYLAEPDIGLIILTATQSFFDGVRRITYSTLPANTTQLRMTLNFTSGGIAYAEVIRTFSSTDSYIEYISGHGGLVGHQLTSSPVPQPHVMGGHADFSSSGTLQLEALDVNDNVLAIGTYSGSLSTGDDDD